MLSSISFFLIFVLSRTISAQRAGHFVTPPDAGQSLFFGENVVLTVGDTLQVRWSTNLNQYSVWLWQQSLNIGSGVLGLSIYTKILGGPDVSGFNWTISQQAFDLSQSNVFFLALGPTQEITSNTVTCHYFNLTMKSTTTSSTSSTSTTSTVSSSATATATTATTARTSPSSITASSAAAAVTSTSTPADGDSSALKIGLGVGIPVGLVSLLLGACLLGYLRRRRQRNQTQLMVTPAPPYSMVPSMNMQKPLQPLEPQEMHAQDQPYYMVTPRNHKWADRRTVMAELSGDGRR